MNLQIFADATDNNEAFNIIAPIIGMSMNEDQSYKQICLEIAPFNTVFHCFYMEDEEIEEMDRQHDLDGKVVRFTAVTLRLYYTDDVITSTELELAVGDNGLGITLINTVKIRKAAKFEDWL